MGSFTNYLGMELLDHTFGKGTYSVPTIYLGLSSTAPNEAGGNITEPSGGNYSRKATTAGDWNTATSTGASGYAYLTNANTIEFDTASGTWNTQNYFVLFDGATTGNVLGWGSLSAQKNIGNGDTARFAASDLTVKLD